jgi:AbrB family transcriptional regulator (stage V sporulation protein T)
MEERNTVLQTEAGEAQIVADLHEEMKSYTIGPIVANGDPIGAVVIFSKEQSIGEVEHKAVETAAGFLARQMEH